MKLNHKIRCALIEIKFVERYEALSNKFNEAKTPSDKRLIYIDGTEIMHIISDLGYLPQFDAKEKFYKIHEECVDKFEFGFHILLCDGKAELVWVVKEDGELILGSPWGTYSRRIIDAGYRIKKPTYGTYEDLEEILKCAFEMYEDFKQSLLAI